MKIKYSAFHGTAEVEFSLLELAVLLCLSGETNMIDALDELEEAQKKLAKEGKA